MEQYLIRAYSDEQHMAAVFANATDFYRRFRNGSKRRALACIGSMKSLPVFKCVVANAFRAEPFATQTIGRRSQDLRQRAVPIYSHSGLNLGLFLIRYTFAPQTASDSHSILVEPKATEVIAVPESALVRRLEGVISAPKPPSKPTKSADPRRPR